MTRQKIMELRALIVKAAKSLTDDDAYYGKELFDRWDGEGHDYSVGDRVRYGTELYKCITAHTSQSSWNPADAHSLWVRIDDPAIEFPEWVQPTGATDAYPIGAKVSHNNKHWISKIDANVYEPGAVPESIWEEVA